MKCAAVMSTAQHMHITTLLAHLRTVTNTAVNTVATQRKAVAARGLTLANCSRMR